MTWRDEVHFAGQRGSNERRRLRPRAERSLNALVLATIVGIAAAAACAVPREERAADPTWSHDVGPLLRARCADCHAGSAPPGGFGATNFVDAVACNAAGEPLLSRITAALASPTHAGLVSPEEAALLARWVAAGAPAIGGGVHAPSFVDPRSPEGHGAFLRARAYRPMKDAADPDACATCHEGAGLAVTTAPAPGATACTTCHTEPDGPFACTTCHGAAREGRAYPPRDRCFHPDGRADDPHAAHAGPSASRAAGLACATCHPSPAPGSLAPPHADGHLSVWFAPESAGLRAAWDADAKSCTGTCHARGGARPVVSWTATDELSCNDCHASPPPAHYAGACTSCHREADAHGTSLVNPVLHVNGKVDLGDGSGACGACHGRGEDPWPETGAHRAHASPTSARPVACGTCHVVPAPGAAHPLGKGGADVKLGGLAIAGARVATWDPATKSCSGTYCHAYVGGATPAPRWDAPTGSIACGSCHASPPPPPHIQDAACGTAGCHEGLSMRSVHVDGIVDRFPR